MKISKPDLSQPLIHEPKQAHPTTSADKLGPLQGLVGTWTSQKLKNGAKGGPEEPYSYCVMVLPQVDRSSPDGYI
jgi:hypothetical protein